MEHSEITDIARRNPQDIVALTGDQKTGKNLRNFGYRRFEFG